MTPLAPTRSDPFGFHRLPDAERRAPWELLWLIAYLSQFTTRIRSDPFGFLRLPDDTWILRPQDVNGGFAPESDTWYLPRVCGTFKERTGWHGCQMPEQLLGRIIRGCSNPGATVLDPFGGSGTTLTVAKKLGRRFLGFELSPDYASAIEARLASAKVGQSLEGGVEPLAGGKGRARSSNRPL